MMDLEAGCSMSTSAESGRALCGHIGHGNNQSQRLQAAFITNGARQFARSVNWIRVKDAGAIISLTFLLVCGLITVGLELVKSHDEHRWHEGFGIVVAVLVHFLMEWLFQYLQRLAVQGRVCERPEGPHGYVLNDEHGGTLQMTSVPVIRPTTDHEDQRTGEEARMMMLAELRSQDQERLFIWWHVVFAFVVGVIFMIPLIRSMLIIERGLTAVGNLGLWDAVMKPGLDTVMRLLGIVKIMESVIVIWVGEEAHSLVAIHNGGVVLSLLHGSGRASQSPLNPRCIMLQKLMQLQLVPILTALVVNFVTVVCTDDLSLSVAQLLWVLAVVRLGELGLAKEEPAGRTEN